VEKGQKTLVKALAEVVKAIPAVQLLMIGYGPDKLELMRLSEELGVDRNIVWLGQQDQAEVYKLYGVMDIVVVPSLFEGFGLTAAEAMAAEVPVIASNVDGVAEVVKDGETGALFPVGNSQALAESLIHLLNNPRLAKKFGQNGRDRVQEYFSLDQFSASMLRIYGQYQFLN
jgi:glycosyltransferase involved in cell wall biosynthesis